MEEKDLVNRILNGDNAAFKGLFDLYSAKVYNIALGYLQNNEDAEDLTQDIFLQIYKSIGGFKHDSSLNTWIYRIAVNKSLEFIRNKSRKKRFAFVKSIFHKDNEEFEIEDFIHPGIILENKERAGILFKAIDRLPEKQKTAFILNKIEYLRYDEISEVMNLSKSSVESLIHRAKSNLQKYLYDFYQNN